MKRIISEGVGNISGFLRHYREEKEVSLKELQDKSGVSVSALSRWERGERVPDVIRLEKVLKALGAEIIIISK